MSKQIWLAPILNNNRERLLERASEVLAEGPTEALLYIAASRPLLELAANRLLDGERIRGVWGSLPVHLFRGFARFVLATAIEEETGLPLPPRIAIDREELPLKRSLVSQIIKQLAREGALKGIAPLAARDGCINSIATLIGEIQRAGKTPSEFMSIVEARERDFGGLNTGNSTAERFTVPRQIDFDREVAMVYSEYVSALGRSGFTEDDADQLRALEALRGEADGKRVSLPWLRDLRLLVLDGFFDFTPVQGEMLRLLIPAAPEVVVNLNRDRRNAEVFRPFQQTIDQLASMADFEVMESDGAQPLNQPLSALRERLFNATIVVDATTSQQQPEEREESALVAVRVLECSNRQTEVRAIAKEVKRLILTEGFRVDDIALVGRQIDSYEDTIVRVFGEEGIPCALGRRIAAIEIPAVRAAVRLIDLLIEMRRAEAPSAKMSDLADLIKSGFFRLSEDELSALSARHSALSTRHSAWDADQLENIIAYVGAELRVENWLARARLLRERLTGDERERLLGAEERDETDSADDETPAAADETVAVEKRRAQIVEFVDVPLPGSERKPKPARDVDPALIEWAALVIERLWKIIASSPREAAPRELRDVMMRLLDCLQFSSEVQGLERAIEDRELPALTLDLRGLESLRRALSTACRSFEISERDADKPNPIKLASFLDEVIRCLRSQTLVLAHANPDGLKVLEVTDVRGLRFRAVFIAGLIEGEFPLRASRDWLYPHEERERLKQYGLTLEDISPDTLLREEHYFYQAACRATERLYLSRPLVVEDGSETVASYYIDEVRRAVAPLEIKKEVVRSDFDGRSLFDSSRSSELAVALVRQEERRLHRAQMEDNFAGDVVARLMAQARDRGYLSEFTRRRIAIERERGGRSFGMFDGVIADSKLLEKLRRQYGADHDFSASELSLYGKCPFKFFAEKVLKLEPRGEAALDLSALDAGSLLHEALRRFFERHRGQRLSKSDREKLRRELGEVADAVFDQHEHAVPPLNSQVWKIDREIRKLMLEQVLDYELELQERTRSKQMRPEYFELAFGMKGEATDSHSTEERLELRKASGERGELVRLRGQIDRVDVAADGTAIAYDYKLSRGASLDDMTDGRALQLHIYLAALERLLIPEAKIAGGGYYTIKGAQDRRNKGLYRAALNDYTKVSNQAKSNVSESEWTRFRAEMEARIWEFVDGMREGRFQVEPSAPDTSCPHCDYSDVCRYEKFRIRRKSESAIEGLAEAEL